MITTRLGLGPAAASLLLLAGLACAGAGSAAGDDDPFPFAHDQDPVLRGIEISGNVKSDRDLILRVLDLRLGEPLSLDRMDEAWDALEDCGYYRIVQMEYDDADPDSLVLRVAVEEDLGTYFGPVIRYDRRHKYQAGAWLEERNFRGRGELIRLEAVALYPQSARIAWSRPWFLGRRGLSTELALQAEQGAFVFRPTRYREWGATWDVRWDVRRPFFLAATAGGGRFERRDSFAWPAPGRGEPAPAALESYPAATEDRWRLGGSLGLDSRSNPFYPERGILLEGRLLRWSGGGFPTYLEATLDGRAFLALPWDKHVLALRAWGRRTDRPAHLENLLYWGGPETVRGYPYASWEGDEGYLLSVEYRLPLFLMPISPQGELVGFGLHAFADAGDAWLEGAEPGHARRSWGLGAHLNLDTLQFRFEAARTAEGDWAFEFYDRFNF